MPPVPTPAEMSNKGRFSGKGTSFSALSDKTAFEELRISPQEEIPKGTQRDFAGAISRTRDHALDSGVGSNSESSLRFVSIGLKFGLPGRTMAYRAR